MASPPDAGGSQGRRGPLVARILTSVLIFQLGIGALLVVGDVQTSAFRWPFSPEAPRLSEPARPGDQRRVFSPRRDASPVQPVRDPGDLPERLVLTPIDGTRYRLEGEVSPGDAERIAKQFDEVSPAPEVLILQSPGGSVHDALALGRTLRAREIVTEMLAGEFCYSACPYILAGGVTRRIAQGAQVGVHQHYFGESTILPARFAVEDIQAGQGAVMQYLDEMGIDPLIMQHALTTPPEEIYVLLPEELERYGLVVRED